MRSRLMQYCSDPLLQNHSGVDSNEWVAKTQCLELLASR